MCHKGRPFRPYRLHVWGPTLEVCSNDGYENLANRCPGGNRIPRFPTAQKNTAILRAAEGNGGMYNVMAIISSIITTIKPES